MAKKKSNEELTADLKSLTSKVQTLEKFMNDEKKLKDSKLDKIDKFSESLDNSFKSLKIEVQSVDKRFENEFEELQKKLQKTIDRFNTFQKELAAEIEKLEEKDIIMEKLRIQVKEKDAVLGEKDKSLSNLEKQYSDALVKIAKLEAELSTLSTDFEQTSTLNKELNKKLESTEKNYDEFKAKEEPIMSQNESIRRMLTSNDQGKIYLALVEAHPQSLTLDDLSQVCDTTAVLVKPALLVMEELEVIEFNPSTREVKLTDLT